MSAGQVRVLAPLDPNSRTLLAYAEREEDVRAGPSYHGIQRWQNSQDYPHAFRDVAELTADVEHLEALQTA